MILKKRQEELLEKFKNCDRWEDRYKLIISMGKQLPEMTSSERVDDILIKGCQSQVWLSAHLNEKGNIEFKGDSDAMIVKGLISLLLSIYNDVDADEILTEPLDFFKKMGFESQLTPSRANGLYAMIKQIQYYAAAFKVLKQQGKAVPVVKQSTNNDIKKE